MKRLVLLLFAFLCGCGRINAEVLDKRGQVDGQWIVKVNKPDPFIVDRGYIQYCSVDSTRYEFLHVGDYTKFEERSCGNTL